MNSALRNLRMSSGSYKMYVGINVGKREGYPTSFMDNLLTINIHFKPENLSFVNILSILVTTFQFQFKITKQSFSEYRVF